MDRPGSAQAEENQADPKLWVLCWLPAACGQGFGFPGSLGTGMTVLCCAACAQEWVGNSAPLSCALGLESPWSPAASLCRRICCLNPAPSPWISIPPWPLQAVA